MTLPTDVSTSTNLAMGETRYMAMACRQETPDAPLVPHMFVSSGYTTYATVEECLEAWTPPVGHHRESALRYPRTVIRAVAVSIVDQPARWESEVRICEHCQGQMPPYDMLRFRVFCQIPDHWPEHEREELTRLRDERLA